jgi:hypothetical protein
MQIFAMGIAVFDALKTFATLALAQSTGVLVSPFDDLAFC